MKKRIVPLIMAALVLCGCSSGATSDYKTSESNIYLTGSSLPFDDSFPESTPEIISLTYLGSRDRSELKGLELYKATFAAGYDGEDVLTVEYCSENRLAEVLSEKMSADRSPDLTDKLPNSYPYLMSKNYYADLTPYIDKTAPQWEGLSDYIDYYSYNGHNYFYPETVTAAPTFLVYDKQHFALLDIQDPEELYYDNKWTRTAFVNCANTFASITGGTGIYGENISDGFIASTGIPLFGKNENGKLVSNLNDSAVIEMMDFLKEEIVEKNLTGNFSGYDKFLQGQSAFMTADDIDYESLTADYPEMDLGAVPFPQKDGTAYYAYYCQASCEGFLVPRGAANVNGAASFINCGRIAVQQEIDEHENSVLVKMRSNGLKAVAGENYCFDDLASSAVRIILNSPFSEGNGPTDDTLDDCNDIISEVIADINL